MGRRQGISLHTLSHLACWLNIESTMWMKALGSRKQPMRPVSR